MARTKNKRHKKDNEPLLENFMQKVASQKGKREYQINPKGEISMSDAITQIIEPYSDDVPDFQSMQNLVTYACAAWNVSVSTDDEQDAVNALFAKLPIRKKDREETLFLLHTLIERKKKLFPDVTRKIVDFKVTDRGDDFHIAVASTLQKEN
jgi:hypothetical protein